VLLSKDCINVPPTFKKEKERKKVKIEMPYEILINM